MATNTSITSMSWHSVFLIFLTLLSFSKLHTTLALSSPTTSTTSLKAYKTYIKKACNTTTYSSLCYKSLSPYASTIKTNTLRLALLSLSLSLKEARNTSSMVSKLSKQKNLTHIEAEIFQDCKENIQDTIDELKDALDTLGHLSDSDSDAASQMEDITTWVSSAITDEGTCTDGFEGQKLSSTFKKKIRNAFLNVSRMTSNALSLITSLK
ncbi:21 kDa protein-like [Quillaja saponaria]|uniref:pectinesterase n=1 Tax=Quillaja saponaria TaxID=32244 RepID=A0AAD7L103_QUISA|nr:21 kDa protein-like [Quillaja saponaria]